MKIYVSFVSTCACILNEQLCKGGQDNRLTDLLSCSPLQSCVLPKKISEYSKVALKVNLVIPYNYWEIFEVQSFRSYLNFFMNKFLRMAIYVYRDWSQVHILIFEA